MTFIPLNNAYSPSIVFCMFENSDYSLKYAKKRTHSSTMINTFKYILVLDSKFINERANIMLQI